jgi:hypothetical protein
MSLVQTRESLRLPTTLESQLHAFRGRLRWIKTAEAVCGAVFGVLAAFVVQFAVDRAFDTPDWVRYLLFAVSVAGCAAVPLALHRWIWGHRRLDQLARLLARTYPHFGDELLGIIELVRNDSEQAGSRALCEAAIEQVARDAGRRDLGDGVPNPRHRVWAAIAAVPLAIALLLALFLPKAASNAWVRLLAPWKDAPRYTFASIEPLPDHLVVPHGEPFPIALHLTEATVSRPPVAALRWEDQPDLTAPLDNDRYQFELPAQIEPGTVRIRVGDARQQVSVEPRLRPELTAIVADYKLPDYLGQPQRRHQDVRGGVITLVKGSEARFTATATRVLAQAQVNGHPQEPAGKTITSPAVRADGERVVQFEWQDDAGLAGKAPFKLTMAVRDDEAPYLSCEDLPRQKVVLDTEMLTFKVKTRDDFGVKQVGLQWNGVPNLAVSTPAKGERVLAAGGNDREELDVAGTFSAHTLGIEPQPIELRVYVEDYLPGRERVYSPVYTLYVLNAEQHMIWVTEQLSKWHRQALEVRDRELQLHETNKQMRELSDAQLDQPDTRRRIEAQASAERANGRRLSNLVLSGEDLVNQATRNPEFGVGHLEKWAEMLQILKDIAGNRMPSVADLLKQASQAPSVAATNGPMTKPAGQNRAGGSGSGSKTPQDPKKSPSTVPSVVDRESSQLTAGKKGAEPPENKNAKPSQPRLTLAQTTLMGSGSNKPQPPAPPRPAVDEAVKQQRDLLAEFEKITEELNRVLANLEGSTLVKRLKAASRLQTTVAERVSDHLSDTFGQEPSAVPDKPSQALVELTKQEAKGSEDVSIIMDDMHAYFERRRFVKFKTVLDEMKQLDVVGELRQLGDDLPKEAGLSIAQCEYWSDTLDRWAEDLVDPACCGACPGCKAKGSLPPSIVLEVLQILEGEVNLREETRVAEKAAPALESSKHAQQARALSKTQDELQVRVVKVNGRIRELPDAEADFGYEMHLLAQVAGVMDEAMAILARPETGSPAIAAETEAIELLLQSKRINPGRGGGGGSNPGGGGGGTTNDSAIALLGVGANQKEVREDRGISQATGETGETLPEEFRAGLDKYFNDLEREPATK